MNVGKFVLERMWEIFFKYFQLHKSVSGIDIKMASDGLKNRQSDFLFVKNKEMRIKTILQHIKCILIFQDTQYDRYDR